MLNKVLVSLLMTLNLCWIMISNGIFELVSLCHVDIFNISLPVTFLMKIFKEQFKEPVFWEHSNDLFDIYKQVFK